MPANQVQFGPFTVKNDPAQLFCGTEAVHLRPKSLSVLRYLSERPGQLVSKKELLEQVWTGLVVSDSGLRLCVNEIRAALGDSSGSPQYLATITGRGYRFLEGRDGRILTPDKKEQFVGRESELSLLEHACRLVVDGGSQFVLLSGEPGIGKTTLLNCFLEHVSAQHNTVRVIKAQCMVHFGNAESYGPLLEAIQNACQRKDDSELLRILKRHAPGWLLQMPELLENIDLKPIKDAVVGLTPERMVREFCNFIEALSKEVPLVFVIEDLHWADESTVDLLAALMEHSIPSVLLLGTYRPADAVVYTKPLRQVIKELKGRGRCEEIPLELLSEEDLSVYLSGRLSGKVSSDLVRQIQQRTEGNPLFMVILIEDLIRTQRLIKNEGSWTLNSTMQHFKMNVPDSLRSLILRCFEELTKDQKAVLEAASVVGFNFSSAAIASALNLVVTEVDIHCELLAINGQFIDASGIEEWPDGTVTGRYCFYHSMYLEVLYNNIGESRKIRLHRAVGESLEAGYLDHADNISTILATHFDRGYVRDRAAHYYQRAAETSLGRYSYSVAVDLFFQALKNIGLSRESKERDKQELDLLLLLGSAQIAIGGYAGAAVEKTYRRMSVLCEILKDRTTIIPELWLLAGFHMARADLDKSRNLIEQLDNQREDLFDDDLGLIIDNANAQQLFFEGEFSDALVRCNNVLAQYDNTQHRHLAEIYSQEDPGLVCSSIAGLLQWLLGFPTQSTKQLQDFQDLSMEIKNPHSIAFGLLFSCITYQLRDDARATQKYAEDLINISREHAIYLEPIGHLIRGWALSQQFAKVEYVEMVKSSLGDWMETGQKLLLPYCLGLVAQSHWALGNVGEAQESIAEALALTDKTNERWSEAELHRLQGELGVDDNEAHNLKTVKCFERALQVSRDQQARSLELRAALSLGRLWMRQGRSDDTRQLLLPIIARFPEETKTKDLLNAKSLIKGN